MGTQSSSHGRGPRRAVVRTKATRATIRAALLIACVWSCGGNGSNRGTSGEDAGLGGGGSSSGSTSSGVRGASSGGSGSGGGVTASSGSSGSGSSGSNGSTSSSSSGSGASGGDAGLLSDAAAITADAFYVATTGNDNNPGTFAQPFATLSKAQSAMQASATKKTTYVRAGTYTPATTGGNCFWGNASGSSIALSSADDGETWSTYPPDGYGNAILDGQSTTGNSGGTTGNGTGCGFGASQVKNVTVVGLQFQNYRYSAFWGYAATATVRGNVIHDTRSADWGVGAIILTASPGAVVDHNTIYNVAYNGIAIEDNSAKGDSMGNTTVAGNIVVNACTWPAASGGGNDQNGGDCGAIYLWSQNPSTSTNLNIANNYVRDVNVSSKGAGDFGSCCALGIYLDDGVNDVTSTGNVITGITSGCFMIHGGISNVFRGNLCDLGSAGTEAIVIYQSDSLKQTMLGNVFEDNVVVAGSTGAGHGFWGVSSPPNPMTIKNNAYFNYVGSTVDSNATGDAAGNDSNPTYVNPQVSCWAPTIASGSTVLGPPVAFPGILGGWGPPGSAMPQTGTPPSWPHGC
jgi:hypothetical protein